MPPKTTTAAPAAKPVAKKTGAAPKKGPMKKTKTPLQANPLFPSRARSSRIGGDLRPKAKDLSRFVRWPKYVRLQRQRKILMQRLKVPPSINQFRRTLDKNQAAELFKLLMKYQPETKAAKLARREAKAAAVNNKEPVATSAPAPTLKFGLRHVTSLIEKKKAKLVVIAHDVDPIELVVWLPALCRKMDIPYVIIKGKARLGTLTHMKTTSVLAITKVGKEDEEKLKQLAANAHSQFNEVVERKWGGGIMGLKTQAKLEKRRQQLEQDKAKKLEAQR